MYVNSLYIAASFRFSFLYVKNGTGGTGKNLSGNNCSHFSFQYYARRNRNGFLLFRCSDRLNGNRKISEKNLRHEHFTEVFVAGTGYISAFQQTLDHKLEGIQLEINDDIIEIFSQIEIQSPNEKANVFGRNPEKIKFH